MQDFCKKYKNNRSSVAKKDDYVTKIIVCVQRNKKSICI